MYHLYHKSVENLSSHFLLHNLEHSYFDSQARLCRTSYEFVFTTSNYTARAQTDARIQVVGTSLGDDHRPVTQEAHMSWGSTTLKAGLTLLTVSGCSKYSPVRQFSALSSYALAETSIGKLRAVTTYVHCWHIYAFFDAQEIQYLEKEIGIEPLAMVVKIEMPWLEATKSP